MNEHVELTHRWHTQFAGRSPTLAKHWLLMTLNTSTEWDTRAGNYDELAFYLASGLLTIEEWSAKVEMNSTTWPLEGGEGERHRFAKEALAEWIGRVLIGKPEREPHRYNGRIDIYCPVNGIVAECGSVSPTRVLDMIMDDAARRVFIVPFWKQFHDCFEGRENRMPILEWRLVGEWQAVRANREEDSFERLRKGLECLDEQTAEPFV